MLGYSALQILRRAQSISTLCWTSFGSAGRRKTKVRKKEIISAWEKYWEERMCYVEKWCKLSKVIFELLIFPVSSHLCYRRVVATPPAKENPKSSLALQQWADLAIWTLDNCCNSRLCRLQKTSCHHKSHGDEKNQWAKKPTPLLFIHQTKQWIFIPSKVSVERGGNCMFVQLVHYSQKNCAF